MRDTIITTAPFLAWLGTLAAFGAPWPRVSYRRVGGLRFLRVGRLQMSFCLCRK